MQPYLRVGRWVTWQGNYCPTSQQSCGDACEGTGLCVAEDGNRLLVWTPLESAGKLTYSYPDLFDVPFEAARLASDEEIEAARKKRGVR